MVELSEQVWPWRVVTQARSLDDKGGISLSMHDTEEQALARAADANERAALLGIGTRYTVVEKANTSSG